MENMIKVNQLMNLLKELDPELPVILQKDPEGNDYSPMAYYATGKYKILRFHGLLNCKVGSGILTPEMKSDGITEKDVVADGEDALIFVPYD